jgi:tRNA threonylcarbamoyladenosine biosynthesis protein TsaE
MGRIAAAGTILLLQGDLGSGKTTFVQGLGQSLGITEPIVSPTFTLVQEYREGRLPLFHCDFYRLSTADVFDLDLDELWESEGIVTIEWPERLPEWPPNWLHLLFVVVDDDTRQVTVRSQGKQHEALWQQVCAIASES